MVVGPEPNLLLHTLFARLEIPQHAIYSDKRESELCLSGITSIFHPNIVKRLFHFKILQNAF